MSNFGKPPDLWKSAERNFPSRQLQLWGALALNELPAAQGPREPKQEPKISAHSLRFSGDFYGKFFGGKQTA